MARPRSFDEQAVLQAARNSFWGRGFEATGLGDLEAATGVGRSSLYLLFGSKKALFEAALEDYEKSFVEPLLGPIEARGAGLREAAAYFTSLCALFRGPWARRGCMMVNAITELGGGEAELAALTARFAVRYRSAFSNALMSAVRSGDMHRADVEGRTALLAASAIGAWVVVRADPVAASDYCLAISTQIRSWGCTGASG